jgi:anaerobic dimethyl sulfoxide reductase subunit B (iron-sulfur subunit)
VVACKDVNDLPVGFKLRKVVVGESGGWQADAASGLPVPVGVFSYSLSFSCMHCARPACVAACPRQAARKDADTGIVWIDQEQCVGCGRCAKACPWDAPVVVPRMDGARRTRKCDLCRDLLAVGEEPACVAACSMRCLAVVEFPGADAERAPVFDDPLLASAPQLGPHFAVVPHRGLAANPGAEVRVHSMPEEYENA